MFTAQDHVLFTPELFEHILSHLPTRDLLFAQRTSRHFQKAISSSPRLQQLLFFRPSSSRDGSKWTLNPLLREAFLPWFVLPGGRWLIPTYESIELLNGLNDPAGRAAFLRPEASWRRMLLVQPPPKALAVMRLCHSMLGDFCTEACVPCEDGGVRMGIVYDLTESFLRHRVVSSFGLAVADEPEEPRITLYLEYTVQCCPHMGPRKWDLRSQAAEAQERELEYVDWPASADSYFRTDLTVERGGVDHAEFSRWERARRVTSSGDQEEDPCGAGM